MKNIFAIICYKVFNPLVNDECGWMFEKIFYGCRGYLEGTPISKKRGKRLIKENGMILSECNKYGIIWELPGQPIKNEKLAGRKKL